MNCTPDPGIVRWLEDNGYNTNPEINAEGYMRLWSDFQVEETQLVNVDLLNLLLIIFRTRPGKSLSRPTAARTSSTAPSCGRATWPRATSSIGRDSRELYRVTHLLADWVMLTQFRLRITSKCDGIDLNIT